MAVLLTVFAIYTSFTPGGPGDLLAIYHRADSLFHLTNNTPATDSMALIGFEAVIAGIQSSSGRNGADTLLTEALLRKGILLDAAANYARATTAYREVLAHDLHNDSMTFVAEVYAGTAYYNLNNFDSANYFLLRAETLVGRYGDRDDEVRLYNTLGVLYYDNGDYRQGKDYFDRALGMVREKRPVDMSSTVSLQTNIATSFFRLGEYQEALAIYRQLTSYRPLHDYIYMNMGRAYVGANDFRAALACFRQVDAHKLPGVWNEMADAQSRLGRPDSCGWYLSRLQTMARMYPDRLNSLDLGINALYAAGSLSGQEQYEQALATLQKAICIFSLGFRDSSIYSNPQSFTGTFAYYRLFDALVEKAGIFGLLYKRRSDDKYLKACYAAYASALSLLRHIEKSYATDEAKLFLKKKGGPVYSGALDVCLQLYRLHPDKDYLEQAFLISEKSKASVITANLREGSFTNVSAAGRDLLQKVYNCKYNIARLNVRSEAAKDSGEIAALAREEEGDELELSRLQKALERNGEYYRLKYGDASPGVTELQGQLQGGQALISLYAAGGAVHVFVITSKSFSYTRIDSMVALQSDVEAWLDALRGTGDGRRFAGDAVGRRLYERLIKPIKALARESEWIIIPDGFLYLLPWESLPADESDASNESNESNVSGRRRLVETTTISYRWSSRLLGGEQGDGGTRILSFAPFTARGDKDFNRLPASAAEISGLTGTQYLDGSATKSQFLRTAGNYPIIHLATHAVSSMDNAAASFIAFYPGKDSLEDRLFLEELYGLNLRGTSLVVISACETGRGEVVAQEGVISLARAFTYAGVGSTINSLWKADDEATCFIIRRFYIHLQEGETKARALQLAKIDYLKSDAPDKSPAYWAHLVLTGDSSPLYERGFDWKWLLLLAPVAAGIVVVVRRRAGGGSKVQVSRERKKKKSAI
jgi:CHAT domain-containing protein